MDTSIILFCSGGPLGPYGQRTISKTNQVNHQNTSLINKNQKDMDPTFKEIYFMLHIGIGTMLNHYCKTLYYGPLWKIKEDMNNLT